MRRSFVWSLVFGGVAVACGTSSDLGGTGIQATGGLTYANAGGTGAYTGAAGTHVGGLWNSSGGKGTGGVAMTTGGGPNDGGIPWDALPTEGGPAVDCALCARDHCSQEVDVCVATTACLGGIVCALLSCQSVQSDCLLPCFGGDNAALTAGINAASCMGSQCGPDCARALGL